MPNKMVEPTMEEQDHNPKDWVHTTYMKYATPLVENAKVRLIFWIVVAALFIGAMLQPAWQFIRPAGIN
ncbi:MAG: hypothetical protein Q9N62_00275 [Ghiorsea sp.]|nr:hypothetical protein [Ghiorsea sp.]